MAIGFDREAAGSAKSRTPMSASRRALQRAPGDLDWSAGRCESGAVELGSAARALVASAAPGSQPGFAWSDAATVATTEASVGSRLSSTTPLEFESRARASEQFADDSFDHPMGAAVLPSLEAADIEQDARAALFAAIEEAGEATSGLGLHRPYVLYELDVPPGGAAIRPSAAGPTRRPSDGIRAIADAGSTSLAATPPMDGQP